MKYSKIRGCAIIIMLLFLTGCAAEQTVSRRYFWPPLPDRPRIEWKGSYRGSIDFPKDSFSESFAMIVGSNDDDYSLVRPIGIAANDAGIVYVTQVGLPFVSVFNLPKQSVSLLADANAAELFKIAYGLATDSEGNIYVSDPEGGKITTLNSSGAVLQVFPTSPVVGRNTAIAFDRRAKRLLVVDVAKHAIAVFDTTGRHLFSFGKQGNEDGELNYPSAVTINSRDEIIVADSMNARIQIFDQQGKFLRKFGERSDRLAGFQAVKGVAVDSEDNIYVTDGRSHSLKIFNINGDHLITIGGPFSAIKSGKLAPGGFLLPHGIFIDKSDRIYIADQLNNRFQVFQFLSDSYLRSNPL